MKRAPSVLAPANAKNRSPGLTTRLSTESPETSIAPAFGGSILAMIDLCAYATASKFAGHICVTASFDRVDFHDPINVGELVTMARESPSLTSSCGRTASLEPRQWLRTDTGIRQR